MVWPAGEAALVTGAASGIGRGIARALVAAGAKVAIADISPERIADVERELTAAGGTVVGIQLDVSDPEQWEAAAERAEEALGPISILCNNAGVNGGGLIEETPLKVWDWIYGVNIRGQFLGVSTFLPRFRDRGGRAHIVNTASMAGLVPMAGVGAYSSSKFASVSFSMVLRDELADSDIDVSVLCPGTVATPITINSAEAEAGVLGTDVDAETVAATNALAARGADPDRVGEQVVEAMQARQFAIVTHKDWQPLVDRVHDEFTRAFDSFDGRHGPDQIVEVLLTGAGPLPTTDHATSA